VYQPGRRFSCGLGQAWRLKAGLEAARGIEHGVTERKIARLGLGPMCGRLQVGKDFLHACSIGRCGHVFGLRMRFT
jgi:hypothetical protein